MQNNLPVTHAKLSTIGDFCVMTGN